MLGLAAFAVPCHAGAPASGAQPSGAQASSSGTKNDWPIAGRQGIVLVVIVPEGVGADMDAYARQLDRLCAPDRTCFVNFYGNPTGVTASVPLPDAIAREPTAMFRRSMKNQAELFRWSCRVNPSAAPECF